MSYCTLREFSHTHTRRDDLKIIKQKKFLIHRDFNQGILDLAQDIQEMAENHPITGIGCGLPGLIDEENGCVLGTVNLPEWEHHPIRQKLKELTGISTFLYHDVAAAAAGEAYYGHAASTNSFVFLIWGTGFGGAKIEKILGKLHITSFEPGHYIADPNGANCPCGQKGCPELEIGGGALRKKMGKDLSEISNDDPLWDHVAEVAGQTVTNVQAFHPTSLIVFGGGLILKRQFLLPKIQEYVKNNLKVFAQPELKITELGDDAALFGAVALQLHERV